MKECVCDCLKKRKVVHAILVVRLIKVDRGVLGHFHWSGMERQPAIKQALKYCGYIYTVKCDPNQIKKI